jgi:replicative DNA helicase
LTANGAPDEADQHKAGKLDPNPKAGTKPVALDVPRVYSVRELLQSSLTRATNKAEIESCSTGHFRLDAITGGIRRGFTWLFGADTSFGKSSWLVSVADVNLRKGKRVLIVSSEDLPDLYADRLMARRAEVSAAHLRDKKLDDEEEKKCKDVAAKGEPVPVYIDARRWPVEDLQPHLNRIIKEEKIDVVAFDYIQEFRSKRRHQDERVKYREIASVLRHTAKDARIAAILFSQLTMSADTKIPNRHNIRECRDIANASEVIIIGFEPDADIKPKKGDPIEAGTKCVLVDKCKNGPRGMKIPLDWNTTSASFNTVEDPKEHAKRATAEKLAYEEKLAGAQQSFDEEYDSYEGPN